MTEYPSLQNVEHTKGSAKPDLKCTCQWQAYREFCDLSKTFVLRTRSRLKWIYSSRSVERQRLQLYEEY